MDLLQGVLSEIHAVECAADVPDALAFLESRRPDAILLDCLLPGGSTTSIMAKARVLGCGVVLMSGLPERLETLAGSGYPCLQKPFTMAELVRALETACARRQDR